MADYTLSDVRKMAAKPESYDPTEGMNFGEKALAGVGKAFVDMGRGAGQIFGLVTPEEVKDSRRLDAPLMRTGGGITGNILGNIAATAPTMFIPGVNTVVGGALTGGALGALQPTTKDESRLGNAVSGTILGGTLPAVIGGYKAAKAGLYDPVVRQNKIIASTLADVAGKPAPMQYVAKTPGVKFSAGQSSGSEALAAIEDAIGTKRPGGALSAMAQSNRNAMAAPVRELAGTPESLAAAIAKRGDEAGVFYDAARAKGIPSESIAPDVMAEITALSNRVPDDLIAKARELAKVGGMAMDDTTSVQGLHWVKKAIDSKIGTAVRAGDDATATQYITLRDDLMNGLAKISPDYAQGAAKFRELSPPINQMQVGQALSNKLLPATAGDAPASLNYEMFARAMRDPNAVAKQATGFSGAKMEKILSPEQIGSVRGLLDDASVIAQSAKRGSGNNSATYRRATQGEMLENYFTQQAPTAARLFDVASKVPLLNMATKGASMVGSFAGRKVNDQLLGTMDDLLANNPQLVSEMIAAEIAKRGKTANPLIGAIPQSMMLSLIPTASKQ
jgi:hypothetical protein